MKTSTLSLQDQVEKILLEFAALWPELPTSDLQGVAYVKAQEIIQLTMGQP